MKYVTNIKEVVTVAKQQFQQLENPDGLLREIATGLLSEIVIRVHRDGLASDGQPIGTYTPEYMRVRTGSYKNADTYKRGAKAGERKNAGYVTRGDNAGAKRKRYNLPADTRVIGVLTGQMRNDLKIIPLPPNAYGIGYSNDENYDKSQYLEQTYNKPIWTPSQAELDKTDVIIEAFLNKTFDA